jgi:predicted nuclease of predicted toxin-antitoxin system
MKLLFDQNVAPALVGHLSDIFPGSAHVFGLNLSEASDLLVWLYARDNDFLLVSKDADFVELTMLRGFPPKVLWLRIGNCVTQDIEKLIRANQAAIDDLSSDPERGVLALFRKGRE